MHAGGFVTDAEVAALGAPVLDGRRTVIGGLAPLASRGA